MAAPKKAANEAFEAFTNARPEAFAEGFQKVSQSFSNFASFNKAAYEAAMASASTLTRGAERATAEQSAFLKAAYDDGVAAFKAAASSKSVQETIAIQADYVRAQTAKNLGYLTKMTEHWTATAKDASEPLSQRYGEFIELVQAYRP